MKDVQRAEGPERSQRASGGEPPESGAVDWHALEPQAALQRLDAERDGLEPDEVERRLERWGLNVLGAQQQAGVLTILLRQFKSVVILVLVGALILSLPSTQWPDAVAIAAVLVVNVLIAFFSEWRARRSMEALRRMGHGRARVRRAGAERLVPAARIAAGDVLLLQPGDSVAADARLLETSGLRANEAPLTGESMPVAKDPAPVAAEAVLAERRSMVFKGTSIADGSGVALVTATGDQTQVGRISQMAREAEAAAVPLEQRLDRLGRRMALLVLLTGLLVAGAGLLAGQPTLLMIETALALAVAAIPEGLPIVATIALAHGMWLMARRNALINKLTAVETLGSTTVIFSDKTGTLTENSMRVVRVLTAGGEHRLGGDGDGRAANNADPLLERALTVGVLCNNAALDDGAEDGPSGDPMEIALLRAGREHGLEREALRRERPEQREEAFDRATMMMATFHRDAAGFAVMVKGAPDAVLAACAHQAEPGDSDRAQRPLDEHGRRRWSQRARQLAGEGLRVLALAEKTTAERDADPYVELRLLGLVGLQDPPRRAVRAAIDRCQAAGIKVVMVSGDQPETARAVAEAVGIVGDPEDPDAQVVHGRDLAPPAELSEADRARLHSSNIFARVSPEQKLDLIELFQQRGEVAAMTGDGVNDAPALKKADIGVAMGRRGTDAAKEVADMVLGDDAFESIAAAVERGRIIFDNIRKSVLFMLCTNGAEVLAVAVASLAAWPLPLRPLQILFLNVLTDVFPALALGVGKGGGQEMHQPPRPAGEAIVNRPAWLTIAGYSGLIGACVLAAMLIGLHGLGLAEAEAVTVSFLALAFGKLWFVFNLRAPSSRPLRNEITANPWIWGSIALCAGLLLAAVYLPGLSAVLKTRPLSGQAWALALAFSAVPLLVGQLVLFIQGRKR